MRAHTTPNSLPGGSGANGRNLARRTSPLPNRTAQPQCEEPANDRDDFDHYDDGLVHGHFWAMSSTVR